MYRTICLSLLCIAGSPYGVAAESTVQEVYQSLAKLHGADYVTARDRFLARPGAGDFLKSRVKQSPEDWFAFVLWRRMENRNFAKMYDRVLASPPIKDRFAGRDFGPALFDPDPLPFGGKGARRFPRVMLPTIEGFDLCREFDWMDEFALEMEWILRNPHDYSRCARFHMLYDFCWVENEVPIAKSDLKSSRWQILKHGKRISKMSLKTLDPDRIRSWLAYARDHEREPIVRLLTASRVPGKKSAAVLEELSKEDSLVGTFAAFFHAGRWLYPSYPTSGGHPFDGPWLEQWSRRATPNQITAARWIFAEEYPNRRHGFLLPPNGSYKFPLLAVGPLIEHHPTLVGEEMKRRYHRSVEGGLKTFKRVLEGYKTKEDVGGFTMKLARKMALGSMLWPKSAAGDLRKINTTDRNARALIAKALSQLGQRAYPTGEDLQVMYGAKKKR